ncbi:hypothetical protein [Desulfosporosinus hippei]|uniref:Uncharacterized protein n=1 Tax=Desulfosporosinus hippei DSM 8344 TaxID=1121419 RepID=A0A1G8F1K7_9FIRM|nr:hypothetical protein [Desulfosporosinus hippei]SDH75992.1 hypothetical protein SAMN05443529_11874 [Desulfosporosinus hippei DSM 8344]
MFGMKKRTSNPNSMFSPPSLFLHALTIGAAVWIGKAWGDKDEL